MHENQSFRLVEGERLCSVPSEKLFLLVNDSLYFANIVDYNDSELFLTINNYFFIRA